MPTYEYVCAEGHEAEHRQSMNSPALEVCPIDGCTAEAERKISMGAGILVGKKATGGSAASKPASASGPCCGPGGCGCSV